MADQMLLAMLCAGQKAAKIARLCRAEDALFKILVQEKGLLKNNKMDFKTLADVFIQEVVKTELEKKFPGISERVFGEENNKFTNILGDTICVEVKSTEKETALLLSKVFNGNEVASQLLAEAAHSHSKFDIDAELQCALEKISDCGIDLDQIAFWIDPIDGTNQYVRGINEGQLDENNVYIQGLQCVTVLIGAYDSSTGTPVMSVVHQPFYEKVVGQVSTSVWEGRSFWGVSHKEVQLSNIRRLHQQNCLKRRDSRKTLVIASAHDPAAHRTISASPDLLLCTGGGAGYKVLCVAEGLVDAYLYTEDGIYKWDTCAPQCLIMTLGGSVVSARKLVESSEISGLAPDPLDSISTTQLKYKHPNPMPNAPWANLGGTLAFTSSKESLSAVNKIVAAMSSNGKL